MSSDQPTQVIAHLDAAELGAKRPIGVLRVTGRARNVVAFTYARSWLEWPEAFPIDPGLPLVDQDQYVAAGALPGIFSDTAPDRWGRTLLDRREVASAAEEGRRPRTLTEWDYLLGVSDAGRMGAVRLTVTPNSDLYLDDRSDAVPPFARLRDLEEASRDLERPGRSDGRDALKDLQLLLAPGSSLGGARPKVTYTAEDGSLWIAKFPSQADVREVGAWEYVLTELAAHAGINVSAHKLLTLGTTGRTYAARRFDREGENRRLFASAMTLIGRRDGDQASYLEIAMAIADHGAVGSIEKDLEELFCRVVFSVLVANRDDHLRNHAFIRSPAGWRLAPAFDLNPTPEKPFHTLALDERNSEPSLEIVRATADWYRLKVGRADEIIESVQATVATWPTLARGFRLAKHEISLIEAELPPAA